MANISPSSYASYNQCPLLFRFKNIDKIQEEPSIEAVKGTLTHSVLEILFKEMPPQARTLENAISKIDNAFDSLKQSEKFIYEFKNDSEIEQVKLDTKKFIETYFKEENPKRVPMHKTELFVSCNLKPNLRLVGFADRVDISPKTKQTRIVDYKTGKYPSKRFQNSVIFQLLSYALAIYANTGELPAGVMAIFLGNPSGKVTIYKPEIDKILGVQNEYLNTWSNIEKSVIDNNFVAKKSKLCGWCSYKNLCPEFDGVTPESPQNIKDFIK
jgi:putative RecB family exonuclease